MSHIQYFLTYHAIERFQERFPEITKEDNTLKQWKRPKDVNCVKDFFDRLVKESEENRSYFNNTKYMVGIYETYGYNAEFKFLENLEHGILFVIAKERNENHCRLVTVMPTEYKKKFALNHIKYNEKEKKEEKKQKKILEIYNHYQKTILSFENESLSIIDRLTELEKINNFHIQHDTYLSTFLNDLTKLNQQQHKKGSVLSFKSRKYEYSFKKEDNCMIMLQVSPLSDTESLEQIAYFTLKKELLENIPLSIVKEQFNKNVSLRSIVANYLRYNVKYYENLNDVEIVNTELLSQEELLAYCNSINIELVIQRQIDKKLFILVEDNIYKTQIEDKIFTFKHSKNKIEFLKVDNLFNLGITISHIQLEQELMYMNANNQTELVKTISSAKKIKKAILNNKLITFMSFSKIKYFMILNVEDAETSKEKVGENVNSYHKPSDDNNEILEQTTLLTETLSRDDEFFFKKYASEDNMIQVINKRKSIHKIQYKGFNYEFLLNKSRNEGYLITVLKKEA